MLGAKVFETKLGVVHLYIWQCWCRFLFHDFCECLIFFHLWATCSLLKHRKNFKWFSCIIFCRKKDSILTVNLNSAFLNTSVKLIPSNKIPIYYHLIPIAVTKKELLKQLCIHQWAWFCLLCGVLWIVGFIATFASVLISAMLLRFLLTLKPAKVVIMGKWEKFASNKLLYSLTAYTP